ncbi:hypothetical protein [Amycolatopsis jiangsuensis]|uniref:Putative membrane protein n=1 Tax=Amycolatopsis jiangsuensis TaxID=1181879 RepID=A0A840IZ73_9PSEU|nr:hypothetical protein [Amycolatopsis jiangsuensis]MBB4686597.1 putative membrane protein [Amycolatopsis jiangsuensis]
MADNDEPDAGLTGGQPRDQDKLTDDQLRKLGRAPDPVLPGQTAAKASPPRPVHLAFVLVVVAAVVLVAGQVVTVLYKQQLVDEAIRQSAQSGQKFDAGQVQANATTLVWALFVGALCFGALMVLFAWKSREGTRSARTVVTLLAVLGLVFQLGLVRSVFSVVSSLLLVIALVLLYLPSVAEYFPKVGKKL